MSTLIAISGLGILCLLLEILNLRKILVPITCALLAGILGMTYCEYQTQEPLFSYDTYNMIVDSGLGQIFSMLLIILAILIVGMSPKFYENNIAKIADYISIKIFMLAGAVAMVSFGNFAMFFIGLEVLSVGAYVLAASRPKDSRSNEAGMKYFMMGAFASSFVLFGIALVYGATGSFDVAEIKMTSAGFSNIPVWFYAGLIMISIGMLFKASIVPFHFWAPDVYEGSPTLVTTMMSTLVKVAAIASFYKIVLILSAGVTPAYEILIIVLSILSMTIGNITALRQNNIKRMMAFSGISHAGFMIMPLLVLNEFPNTLIYYTAAYGLAGIAAFAVIMAVCESKGSEDISNFNGLAKRDPLLAVTLSGAMLSMGGIPVFAGFFAKLFVFNQMLEANHLILVIFGIINSIIAIYYYFRVVNAMFLKSKASKERINAPVYTIVGVIALLLNLIIGIFPSIIMGIEM